MSFPIEFMKKSGDYDFVSPVINYTGTAAVIGLAGTASYLGLKALGLADIAPVAITIAVDMEKIGAVGVAVGGVLSFFIYKGIKQALGSR